MRRSGSGLPLLALGAAFLLLFAWQRSRSDFLVIEARRPAAERLAAQHGLAVADVLALHDLVGSTASAEVWRELVRRTAAHVEPRQEGANQVDIHQVDTDQADTHQGATRRDLGAALASAGCDPLAVRRFRLLRERFAARR